MTGAGGGQARTRVFIQARMSSRRFPGKVLAPFRGEPMVWQVIAAVRRALVAVPVVVATSTDPADDPLVLLLERRGVPVFRGSRDDVFERFRACARTYPSEWILRICGDSPLLDRGVLQAVVAHAGGGCDLVTTRLSNTFPKGQNAELIRASVMASVDGAALSAHDREHVTPFFYRNADRFRIVSLEYDDPGLARLSFVVDEVEDLRRLEDWPERDVPRFAASRVRSRGAGLAAGR